MIIRYRFKTWSADDPRPLIDLAPIKMPWWCTGIGFARHETKPDDDEYAVIVCYLPKDEDLKKYWDDAFDIEAEEREEIIYTDRFPKPEWCKEGEE